MIHSIDFYDENLEAQRRISNSAAICKLYPAENNTNDDILHVTVNGVAIADAYIKKGADPKEGIEFLARATELRFGIDVSTTGVMTNDKEL